MFGTVRPCNKVLSAEEIGEYKKYYCGLCMGMGRCTGGFSRFLINYDMCVAYLLADSVNLDENYKVGRCPYAPWRKVQYIDNEEILNKISKLNFLLAYFKLQDDVLDENSIIARVLVFLLKGKYKEIQVKEHFNIEIINKQMEKLHEIEKSENYVLVKDAAKPFAELLEQVMGSVLEEPLDAEIFAAISKLLGSWVYIVDACVDLKKDMKKHRYNPIAAGMDKTPREIIKERRDEIFEALFLSKNQILQLLEILNCSKNKELIYSIFNYDLPKEVAQLLSGGE